MKHEVVSPFRPASSGNLFKRWITIKTIASLRRSNPADVALDLYPNDRTLLEMVTKAASSPAMTTTTGWAAELVQRITFDVVSALGLASGAADVMRAALTIDWNGAGSISAPGFVASANNASFVQEGNPIPVRQLSSAPVLLQPYKLATIAVLTREMIESGNAEALISDALVRSCGLALDTVFFGTGASTSAQPAGIRNGIVALTASSSTDPFGAFFDDMSTLLAAVGQVGGKGPYILVGGPGRVAGMKTRMVTETGDIMTVISGGVGNDLIAIAASGLVAALGADPDVETSSAATLVMDTAPGAAGLTGAGEKEMYQSDSTALKVRWPVSWQLRDTRAVAWLTPTWK